MAAKAASRVAEAFVHRAAPGGIPDEEYFVDEANFAEFVRQEVKGRVPAKAASFLRRQDVGARWLAVLRGMASDVEGQLERRAREAGRRPTGRPARFGSDAEYARWRDSAEGYLKHVRRRIAEAEAVFGREGEGAPGAMPPGCEDLLTLVRRYLVDESGLPEPERKPRRERAIAAVSEVLAASPPRGQAS